MTSQHSTSKSNSAEVPEAYRIGNVPFLGTTIYLDSRPLIPRTETEWWVEQFVAKHKAGHVLDLFAGSGCVGVAVLKNTGCTVDFGEIEERHLETIRKNIRENADPSRAKVIQTDVWSKITDRYNFILANPPYLSESRLARIEDSVLAFEPREALLASDDGFNLIHKTLEGLPRHLRHGGECWIEHEPEHVERLREAATHVGLTTTSHQDQYGVERYSVILAS